MKRIRDSLTAKIFLLTAGLLLLVSMITYYSVACFLPKTYRNELEENLRLVSEEMGEELERYGSLEEARNFLDLFSANNQASVTLLDEAGDIVFPEYISAEELAETSVDVIRDEGAVISGVMVREVPSAEAVRDEAPIAEGAAEACSSEGEDGELDSAPEAEDSVLGAEDSVLGAEDSVLGAEDSALGAEDSVQEAEDSALETEDSVLEMEDSASVAEDFSGSRYQVEYEESLVLPEAAAVLSAGGDTGETAAKTYPVTIGGEHYTMLVAGTMQSVSQTMEILREILPMILLIAFLAALVCALGASFYLTRPMVRLSRISRKMAALRFDEKCRENRTDEVGVLARSLNELSENLSGALADLRRANDQLKSDMEKEREEERKRTAFFAAASHELKTPVTILKGHLEGMVKKLGAYRDRDFYLERCCQVTNTMEGMVREILAVSRMESGAWEVKRDLIDLPELVRLQIAGMMELLEEKEMELLVRMPDHLSWSADGAMMEKVFRNLLMNAIRYSPARSEIRIFMEERQGMLCFYIENTGAHIPEESLPRLFDAFYRVEDSRNRRSGGSGLGLYIVRMILEQHGALWGAENFREGVRIWFRLGG